MVRPGYEDDGRHQAPDPIWVARQIRWLCRQTGVPPSGDNVSPADGREVQAGLDFEDLPADAVFRQFRYRRRESRR